MARWRMIVPGLALGAFSLLVTAQGVGTIVGIGETSGTQGSTPDLSTAPRVGVDRPKPTFLLYERDKRVHGYKPFQELVDAAPAGSVLKPPPGNYAGPARWSSTPATRARCSRWRRTIPCCAVCA
jgi:nitrous oxidase accessory protein